jgi:citrate synthase
LSARPGSRHSSRETVSRRRYRTAADYGGRVDVAMELEKIALHDDYFVEKKLYPNMA